MRDEELVPLADTDSDPACFVSCLIDAAGKAHVMHLNTRSYAEHKALDKLYKELPEYTDRIAEALAGITDVRYEHHDVEYFSSDDMLLKLYLHGMKVHATAVPAITNPIEDVLTFIQQIRYLLKLK
ncbi:MAG: DUF5856 family protein [Bacilli bacterium]